MSHVDAGAVRCPPNIFRIRWAIFPMRCALGTDRCSALWLVIAILGSAITPYDPIAQDLSIALQPPSWPHPFGTDNFGRDVLSRVMAGTRLDLAMGVMAVIWFPSAWARSSG